MSAVSRSKSLAARIEAWEAEAHRLAELPPDATVEMTMKTGGLRMPIPAPVAAEAVRIALAQLSNLPEEEATYRLGLVPVFELTPVDEADPNKGFRVPPAALPHMLRRR